MGIEYLLRTLSQDELKELTAGLPAEYERRGVEMPQFSGAVAVADVLSETQTNFLQTTAADILASLTPEQQERARVLQVAMAEKFSVNEIPLTPRDFGIVAMGNENNRTLVVMLSKNTGLYRGSYNKIIGDDKAFTIEVDGEQIDTRTPMDWDLYQAFIKQATNDNTNPLPDSITLAEESNEPWAGTWLTGDKRGAFYAHFGYVNESGVPIHSWNDRNDFSRNVCVRPAVVI